MSGHSCVRVGVIVLFTGVATSPAFSNAFTDLFNPAPKQEAVPAAAAAPPAPVREACLSQPGRSTGRGLHWFYHVDGHRKCWYQGAESAASTRQARHHFVKRHAVDDDEDEIDLRKKSIANARAQSPRPESADVFRLRPSATETDDDAPLPATAAATPAPPPPAVPVIAAPAISQAPTSQVLTSQVTPDQATQRPSEVAMLLAEAPGNSETVGSAVPPAAPGTVAAAGEGGWEDMMARVGMLLIVLGIVALFGSLLVGRLLDRQVSVFR